MTRHECPDCGHVHELKAEERIKRLEKRVKELEAKPCPHPHWYYTPTYYPTVISSGSTRTTDSPVTVYSTSSGSYPTIT